jgi:hypothetical protein
MRGKGRQSKQPGLRIAAFGAKVLFPMAAYASFGGAPCKSDFACHFFGWGIVFGVAGGIPISGLIFALLHLGFRNPSRSKVGQVLLGGLLGMVAYEIAAACAALVGAWWQTSVGHHATYPLIGFGLAYVVLAIVSVLYARSDPRHH